MLEKFKKDHPNVSFDATFTAPNDLITKVVQAAGSGTLPDVFSLYSGWYPQMKPADTMLNLDSYVKKDNLDLQKILVSAEAERSYYDGHVVSLPNVNAGAQGLFFFNKALMRKAGLDPVKDAPKNWAEFVNVSKILVKKLNPPDRLDTIAWDPNQMAGQPAVIVFAYGNGDPIVTPDNKTSLMDSPGVVATVRKFDDYVKEVYGPWGGYKALIDWNARAMGVDTSGAQVQAFVQGKQVFYVSGSWTISQVQSADSNFDLGLLPVPGFKGQQGGIAKNGWSYGISKNTKNAQVAWEFLKFMTIDPAGNGWFCEQQGRPCPIASVNDSSAYKSLGPIWNDLVKSMNMDIVPKTDIYQDVLKPWLRDIPTLRAQGQSIDTIMKGINKKFQGYLNDIYG
jgi:multiple sugar transport system substrate-binding protein